MFFSRIPVFRIYRDTDSCRRSNIRYLPLVGCIVGAISAAVFIASCHLFGKSVAVVLSMISSIILTGAFHEDGLADTADAFGGAFEKEKILAIMKDSRIGTYGALALISSFALKFMLLNSLPVKLLPPFILAAHSFSRIFPLLMVGGADYISDAENAKSSLTADKISVPALCFGILTGSAPLFLIDFSFTVFLITIPLLFIFLSLRKYFLNILEGYTGDLLGAFQQIFEILTLLFGIMLWKFNL